MPTVVLDFMKKKTMALETLSRKKTGDYICMEKAPPGYPLNTTAFNTNGIVYDNSPWRPGREMDIVDQPVSEEDERGLKSLATRIMSNGVEVLVKDKNADNNQDQRTIKYMHMTSLKLKPLHHHTTTPTKSLLSSALATFVNHQQMSAFFPLHQLMQHNYIIKTCMTTYTYLTTVIHDKRSVISTFETILSVVTTESLTNVFTNLRTELKPTKIHPMEEKTILTSTPSNMFMNNLQKIEKRIDDSDNSDNTFDLIQPSEPNHSSCKSSCPCPHTQTESLNTQYTLQEHYDHHMPISKYGSKITKYGATKLALRPTKTQSIHKSTQHGPYEYDNLQLAPTDRIVEKYTEVINDYSDEKESNSVEQSELLTNEQAPSPSKTNRTSGTKLPERKPEKVQKPNKNKVLVADLLKLGSLGIKSLSQLAPVFEKMTGGFIKRQESNKTTTTTTTTFKPEQDSAAYHVNKRVDNEIESKQSRFPIYIPVDLDTSESQITFTNATLHQNFAWAVEHKQPKSHIISPTLVHESPLVNGGIPISPGEVITANSDVIVGKPAVGGPLTLAASGMKLHNPVNPPPIDSFVAANEQYLAKEKPAISEQDLLSTSHVDDSFDLRPPELPKSKPNRMPRPNQGSHSPLNHPPQPNRHHPRVPPPLQASDYMMKTEHVKSPSSILGNHGRPAYLDYIPSLDKHTVNSKPRGESKPTKKEENDQEIPDNNPSSSEIVSTRVTPDGHFDGNNPGINSKPFLVDIQPSKVANVLIPHGSATALVFAGSSEPHKTGDYVDDPLPYPEPGYFGSFSIDAPQMTNVQNVAPKHYHSKQNGHPQLENYRQNIPLSFNEQPFKNDPKVKWKDTKRPMNYAKIPPPTSNQESHLQVGPKITAYNPDIYRPNNGDFEKYNRGRPQEHKDSKKVIDNEYENYLAVPPPPPPKMHFSQDGHYEKKPYNQRPTVHTKPIQDMNIYLNIQHPVPKPNPEALPPKVTSEIYFAAQASNTKSTPTYTINIPPSPATYGNHYNRVQNYQQTFQSNSQNLGPPSNSFTVVPSPNFFNKSVFTNDISDKDNSYSVTLNTATNVASIGDNAQVIGSSMPVAIGSSSNVDQLNTNIPVGTNFAIHVDDESTSFEGQINQGNDNQETNSEHMETVGDNRWNQSSTEHDENYESKETTIVSQHNFNQNIANTPSNQENVKPTIPSSVNSHANFPMMNEETENTYKVKTVTEVVDELKIDQKRPAKLIPNVPTNSHGWYSSVLKNENNINNIKVESTTRKMIPLIHEYNRNSAPEFGQKVSSAGKPPSEFWAHTHNKHYSNKYNIGKQSGTENPFSSVPPLTSESYNSNYIPSYFGGMKQPAYDIPVRDNSDETTTVREDEKEVYENSEEVYDGEDDQNINENEDDFSSESIKVPVITTSSEEDKINTTKLQSETNLNQDTHIVPTSNTEKEKKIQFTDFSTGTQTKKPFGYSSNTSFESIYNQMKPRPFTVNTVLDHQLQQPHWQINQLMVNSTNVSYEENLELNTGEEISSTQNKASSTQTPHRHIEYDNSKYKRPPRPVYVNHNDNRDDSNIITSIVHINDKRPLIIDDSGEISTVSPILLSTLELNRSSSEIIDLSPPPPTMDYNFKPSTNDEMIMGMSPPPPRTQPPIRTHSRLPSTPRPIPIRTPPPYRTKPPRTLPPRVPSTPRPIRKPINREEVSTYRPPYDTIGNVKRPIFNRDQPSSQLLPPPRELPSKITPVNDQPPPTMNQEPPSIVFSTPTLISSGWLTSSGIDFSSSFNFAPTSVHFPKVPKPSVTPERPSTSTEDSYSYEVVSSSERVEQTSSEKSSTEVVPKEVSTKSSNENKSSEEQGISDNVVTQSSKEDPKTTTDKMKVIPLGNRNRTRKPYPVRNDDKISSINKYKAPPRPTSIIKPTRTLSKPEILYPTRQTSTTRRIIRPPLPPRLPPIVPNIIESSESSIDDNYVAPTEILKENIDSISAQPSNSYEKTSTIEKSSSVATPTVDEIKTSVIPTHQAGNEIKASDEVIPTKTEFRTTVVTLTKTLSEPPKTVSSIDYVNLTHTLTVTHTMTSLVSKSEGAITQTLVLTNTHTSTIVDVITKVQTQVQPTTIVETVTKHIPVPQVDPTPVQDISLKTKIPLDDVTMSSEEEENLIIKHSETTENIQKIQTEQEGDNETFFVVMNKSQNGGKSPPISTDIETGDYEITRNEQVNNNGVSQVLFGEILLAGTPYLETSNVVNTAGTAFSKECQPDCKASRNERCQRIDGLMKCVCRPGFARMFPDRPCKPTYTYSVKLALGSQGNERLEFHESLADNSSKQYHALAVATHEGINRMVMQSDLRDVYHGVHITGFHPVEMKDEDGNSYQGVVNDFYVQLSDNAHESRLKEVIEKYLRHNNYSLGVTDVHAAGGFMEKLEVSDFDECTSAQFHDCSEHAQCFNLRGTYTCSCLEGFADLSVNSLYPGRICSAEPVGCERCNYHGSCYSRDDQRVLCECFQWYGGSACHINLKVVLISLVVLGALLTLILTACAIVACRRPRPPTRSIVTCIQTMPSLHQGGMPSKQRADRRALICDRADSGDAASVQNASLPYMPAKRPQPKKCILSDPPAHDPPPPPPAPAVMIPRARLQHHHHADSRENVSRKKSMELSSEAKLINYLESGAVTINNHDEMRRKHSMESSYSAPKDRHGNKQGALVSAGFKVSTTIRPDEPMMMMKDDRDDMSSINKNDLEAELHFDSLRKSYSQEDMSEWTDAERRIGELTLSEARSVGGTLPASTGRAASSTRLTHQEANTMAERDLGSTFLLPHVHLYKPDLTSDVSEFDSL